MLGFRKIAEFLSEITSFPFTLTFCIFPFELAVKNFELFVKYSFDVCTSSIFCFFSRCTVSWRLIPKHALYFFIRLMAVKNVVGQGISFLLTISLMYVEDVCHLLVFILIHFPFYSNLACLAANNLKISQISENRCFLRFVFESFH